MPDKQPFERELETLLEAPYAYVHIVTHDEARAVALVTRVALRAGRPVREWSVTRGMNLPDGRSVPPGPVGALLDAIEADVEGTIYILKDPHPHVTDAHCVRRLREMEPLVAAFGKSVVFVSPIGLDSAELATDVTELTLPMPSRGELAKSAQRVL